MTNDQESIVGQVSGTEAHQLSHQESVQLTELQPVEQSRIKDNLEYVDHETTDGLKALRSFARGEHHEFATQGEFDCFNKIERSYEKRVEIEATTRVNGTRKRKNTGESRINVTRVTRSNATLEHDDRGRSDRFKGSKRRKKNLCVENETFVDETTKGGNCANHEEDDVEDEVYYYRQQQPTDLCDGSNNEENTNLEILSDGVYHDMANNFSVRTHDDDNGKNIVDTTRVKNEDKKTEKQRRKKKQSDKGKKKAPRKVITKDDECVKVNSPGRNETPSIRREEAEKDLRLKIDGIIQANYLLERENNNVVQRNHNKVGNSSESVSIPKISKIRVSNMESNDSSTKIGMKVEEDEKKCGKSEEEPIKKYSCLMCNSRFKGSGGLRNHYKVVHAAGPVYKCDDCGKEFPLKERLKLHVRTHTGFKPYKCPECHKSFARGGQLVQHRGTHSKIKPYRCNLCAGTFTCAANLALHVKRHNGQKDHKCEICGRAFVRKDALKKHLECLHRDVRSFLCVICNKTFKGHLPQHMRTHAQDRPHGCATCGQRFAQKSQLTVHQRTHSGQRPFRCLVCWQAFAHSTALKLHTRRHTGERPFKCAECNAGFTQLPHWKKHMKCIHGRSEPYSCKNCNSFFRIKNDLDNHEKACHFGEMVDNVTSRGDSLAETAGLGNNLNVNATSEAKLTSLSDPQKFRVMNVERMRLLLAVLLKRISRPERLDELGFGKRLIDEVLQESLVSAGKEPARIGDLNEFETLRKNLETFLEWTVPKEHWDKFRKTNKTPEEILETLTAT